MPLTTAEVDVICDLAYELCGMSLDSSKSYLIESRLSSILKSHACDNYLDLARKAKAVSGRELQAEIVDALTTHETLFFRDNAPFEALKYKVLPELLDARTTGLNKNRIRIWSAACSSGQEPYSIAMTIRELIPDLQNYTITILGTDVSDAVVGKASRGEYASHEIERGLCRDRLEKYFTQTEKGWKVRDELRAMVTFQRFDLHTSYATLGKFDIVMCRNVAIYFTPEGRKNVFNRIADALQKDGTLFVGAAEPLTEFGPRFKPLHHCRAVYYRPNETVTARGTIQMQASSGK